MKYLFREINNRSFDGTGDLLSVSQYTGVTLRSDGVEEGGQLTNAASLEGYKEVEEGDLVTNIMLAWNGSLGFSPFRGITSPAYSIYRLSKNHSTRFFHYLLRTDRYKSEYKRNSTGVVESRLRLYTDDFFAMSSLVPPASQQTAIANFLDRKTALIDQAIAQKERLIELLRERQRIVIQQAVTRGLDPDVTMKDSGVEWIGEVPEHWEVKKLKHILKSQGRIGFKGYTTSDQVDEGEGALVLGASHLNWNGELVLTDPKYLSWKKYYESPEIMVRKGDVLIVQRGSTCGKVALVNHDLGPTTINPSLVLLKQILGDGEYVFLAIKVVLNGLLNIVSTTAIPMLSQQQIDNTMICLPPVLEQRQIAIAVSKNRSKGDLIIKRQNFQISKLKEYRATLIDAAVTGKIRVN